MSCLWPIKTGITFVDVNSIFHLCFWVFMGSNLCFLKMDKFSAMFVSVIGAFLWEAFERYAEIRWPEIWKFPESFCNAYLSDPLTAVIGILFAYYALNHWQY
jgi:hypothetical protein